MCSFYTHTHTHTHICDDFLLMHNFTIWVLHPSWDESLDSRHLFRKVADLQNTDKIWYSQFCLCEKPVDIYIYIYIKSKTDTDVYKSFIQQHQRTETIKAAIHAWTKYMPTCPMCVCVCVCTCVCLSVSLSPSLSFYPSTFLTICLITCLFICLFTFWLPVCPPIWPSVCPIIWSHVCLSTGQITCLPVCLSACLCYLV